MKCECSMKGCRPGGLRRAHARQRAAFRAGGGKCTRRYAGRSVFSGSPGCPECGVDLLSDMLPRTLIRICAQAKMPSRSQGLEQSYLKPFCFDRHCDRRPLIPAAVPPSPLTMHPDFTFCWRFNLAAAHCTLSYSHDDLHAVSDVPSLYTLTPKDHAWCMFCSAK